MEQKHTSAAIAPSPWGIRLNQLFILTSGICLAAVFYVNGTFTKHGAPQPSTNSYTAALPAAKAANGNTVSNVAAKALAFKALLNATQQGTLELTYTNSLARKWSNLPCGASCRNGIEFESLNSAQLTAALEVIKAATGTASNDGYDEFIQNRLAEGYLHANGGGNGYDTTLRWIAFLNTPSATSGWMLQFGGHHYAANIAYNNGHVIGATPYFQGLEPLSFTFNGGTYAPLNDEHDALTAMLASLSASELATAKLTSTFSDVTLVPGETNGGSGTFPATKVGIPCSSLTISQKNLVLAAIQHYVQDMDDATAAVIMAKYTDEIDGTYISFTGSGTSGDASTFLNTSSNYVRIDGPGVWVELACQNGIVIHNQIHYHTVWRDHNSDYGLDLTGAAIDETTTGITEVSTGNLNIYPNPATNQISLSLSTQLKDATITFTSVGSGQTSVVATHISGGSLQQDVSHLAAGVYILRVKDGSASYTGKFNKL